MLKWFFHQSHKTKEHVIKNDDREATEVSQTPETLHKMKAVSYDLASLTTSAPAGEVVWRRAVCKPHLSNEVPDRHKKVNVAQSDWLLENPSLGALNKYIPAAISVS